MATTDADRMVELLQYANLRKVADALGVSRQTTAQWARGRDVNPLRLSQVEQLLRPAPAQPEPPAWATSLAAEMAQQRLLLEQMAARRTAEHGAPAWWAEAEKVLLARMDGRMRTIGGELANLEGLARQIADEVAADLASDGLLVDGSPHEVPPAAQGAPRRAGRPSR